MTALRPTKKVMLKTVEEMTGKCVSKSKFLALDSLLVIQFDDNSFIVIEPRMNWEDLELKVIKLKDLDSSWLVEIGAVSQEEYDEYCRVKEEEQQKRWDEIDKKEFERLKTKFDH